MLEFDWTSQLNIELTKVPDYNQSNQEDAAEGDHQKRADRAT